MKRRKPQDMTVEQLQKLCDKLKAHCSETLNEIRRITGKPVVSFDGSINLRDHAEQLVHATMQIKHIQDTIIPLAQMKGGSMSFTLDPEINITP